ncbi:Spo0E family sporulation regulatory protein-aspartic acid phosphatase [Fictibacillus enclensis]|nr:Spo0E family sporulation regulatory protein-aspartic acid phosphatase [Fictibacillus enclensis]WHY71109.1 Spo0E family sporulation regulatory protein-aspartic acid phosphatase [Fictibacillus enclensis]
MDQYLQTICELMDKLKERFYAFCETDADYSDPVIVKISQELDELMML